MNEEESERRWKWKVMKLNEDESERWGKWTAKKVTEKERYVYAVKWKAKWERKKCKRKTET